MCIRDRSYPAPAPAEIRPNFHIRPDMAARYEVGFDHLSMHLPQCVIGQEFIVLQIRLFAPPYFIIDMWIIPTSSFPFVFHCWLHSYVMRCSLGLQLKNIRLQLRLRLRPRPDLQSQIRLNPAPAGFEKINKSGATLVFIN